MGVPFVAAGASPTAGEGGRPPAATAGAETAARPSSSAGGGHTVAQDPSKSSIKN